MAVGQAGARQARRAADLHSSLVDFDSRRLGDACVVHDGFFELNTWTAPPFRGDVSADARTPVRRPGVLDQ